MCQALYWAPSAQKTQCPVPGSGHLELHAWESVKSGFLHGGSVTKAQGPQVPAPQNAKGPRTALQPPTFTVFSGSILGESVTYSDNKLWENREMGKLRAIVLILTSVAAEGGRLEGCWAISKTSGEHSTPNHRQGLVPIVGTSGFRVCPFLSCSGLVCEASCPLHWAQLSAPCIPSEPSPADHNASLPKSLRWTPRGRYLCGRWDNGDRCAVRPLWAPPFYCED